VPGFAAEIDVGEVRWVLDVGEAEEEDFWWRVLEREFEDHGL